MVQLSETLQAQRERLQERLAEQIHSLPVGNESWQQTERELIAAERALHHVGWQLSVSHLIEEAPAALFFGMAEKCLCV